jgi:hypothetical protein
VLATGEVDDEAGLTAEDGGGAVVLAAGAPEDADPETEEEPAGTDVVKETAIEEELDAVARAAVSVLQLV